MIRRLLPVILMASVVLSVWACGESDGAIAPNTEATDYAEGRRVTTVAQLNKRGGQVIAQESYASDISDFRSQLSKLLDAKPDALHLTPQSEFADGEVAGLFRLVAEVLPVAEKTPDRKYREIGPAPKG